MNTPNWSLIVASLLFTMCVMGEPPTRPSGVELSDSDARDAAQAGNEVAKCMTQVGVDYPVLLQKARAGEIRAVRLFIWLGHCAPLDGAAAEGYTYDLYRVATKVGDQRFSLALAELHREALRSCYRNLCFEVTQENPETRKAADAVAARLPKTIEAMRTATKDNPLWK